MTRSPRLWWLLLLPLMLCAVAASAERPPTRQTSIGIFYMPGAPQTTNLWRDGDTGQRLRLEGRVIASSGRPVANALVELWHADALGGVDESRYRCAQRTDSRGRFQINTVYPGHIERARYYPIFAPRHIHISVSHPGHQRLVSLIYFKGDERLAGNPYPDLAIVLERARMQDKELLFGQVEIVLGASPLPQQLDRDL